jgi:hypothetical protein
MEASLQSQERQEVDPLHCLHLKILFELSATIIHLNSKKLNPSKVNIYRVFHDFRAELQEVISWVFVIKKFI